MCPIDFPWLEQDMRGKHGDRCRKTQLNKSEYECPDGCFKVEPNSWCQDSFSGQPCRVHKGNLYPQIICITDKTLYEIYFLFSYQTFTLYISNVVGCLSSADCHAGRPFCSSIHGDHGYCYKGKSLEFII